MILLATIQNVDQLPVSQSVLKKEGELRVSQFDGDRGWFLVSLSAKDVLETKLAEDLLHRKGNN